MGKGMEVRPHGPAFWTLPSSHPLADCDSGRQWTLASSHPVLRSSEEHLLRFADETGKKIHHLGP